MIDSVRSKLSRVVTQIKEDQFLVEGEADFARLGFQSDEISLNFVDIQSGPFLHIGHDFFGKGSIIGIEKISFNDDGHFIFKITLKKEEL
jgi:hypothetical protein